MFKIKPKNIALHASRLNDVHLFFSIIEWN